MPATTDRPDEPDGGDAYLTTGAGAPISQAEAEYLASHGDDLPEARILGDDAAEAERIASLREGSGYARDSSAAGETWSDADEDGNLVVRGGPNSGPPPGA